jgi:hypothetical protein
MHVKLATSHRIGIGAAAISSMAMDIRTLLRRDHDDLERGLSELLDPSATIAQIRSTLDGVRLGLTAHGEAEDIVFWSAIQNSSSADVLEQLIAESRDAHLEQESALAALVCAPLGSATWHDRAIRLRDLIAAHARYEEEHLVAALRELAPEIYGKLAGRFATERLRQLAMLQPSAPIYVAELAHAHDLAI